MRQSYAALMAAAPEAVRRGFRRRRFRAGEQVLEPWTENESIHILLSGTAEVGLEDAEGRALTLYQYGPDSLFGELELFCGNATKGIRAKTDCEIASLGHDLARSWLQTDVAFTYRLCEDLAAKLLDLTETTQRLNMLPLRLRVLDRLYLEYRAGGLDALSKQALADRVGAPLRSVNRALREWMDRGLVAYHDKRFSLPDPAALSRELDRYRMELEP